MTAAETIRANGCALIDVNAANFDSLPCCGIKNPEHKGRQEKRVWIEANAKFGLRARTLLAPNGELSGYIEYMPGEYAWRGVNAGGYMFIHCIWTPSQYQGKGCGRLMLEACLEDAKEDGKSGVAVMVRCGPWMADHRLFAANGFKSVDTAPPDFELLVRRFRHSAPIPVFKRDWARRLKPYSRGLTLIHCGQCPHATKFVAEIVEAAESEYRIKPRVVDLQSPHDAQNSPTPYATFALIGNGRVLADHPISRTRFRNIMTDLANN
ncbi:MAG TPA: GNAT family N-acetyltransferase [Dongiaceae bacterium]|nr:GNAT family N-acetyltransferase [Dongiaceae bacterium]